MRLALSVTRPRPQMLREDEAWNALLRRAWELFLSEWGGQPEQYGTFVRAVYAFDLAREAG